MRTSAMTRDDSARIAPRLADPWDPALRTRRCALTQASTIQRVVGDTGSQHSHDAVVHVHDHYHVTHHHSDGVLGEFEHRTHYHEHEHNHAPLVHAHANRSEMEEREDHDGTAHTHDHAAPTGTGGGSWLSL